MSQCVRVFDGVHAGPGDAETAAISLMLRHHMAAVIALAKPVLNLSEGEEGAWKVHSWRPGFVERPLFWRAAMQITWTQTHTHK